MHLAPVRCVGSQFFGECVNQERLGKANDLADQGKDLCDILEHLTDADQSILDPSVEFILCSCGALPSHGYIYVNQHRVPEAIVSADQAADILISAYINEAIGGGDSTRVMKELRDAGIPETDPQLSNLGSAIIINIGQSSDDGNDKKD